MMPFMVALEAEVGKQFPAGLMDNCEMDNFPLTLTLSLRGRGMILVALLVGVSIVVGNAGVVLAETWRCTKPDGSVVYSDQNLSGECRKLETLPPLLRVPSVPPVSYEGGRPEATKPA